MAREKKTGGWVARTLRGLGLLGGGCALVAATAVVSYQQGRSLGATPAEQDLYGYMSLLVELGVCGFAFYAGYLYRKGEKWSARAVSLLVIAFMSYSMIMFYGFGATNRIVPEKLAQARHLAEVDAWQKTEDAKVADKDKQLNFLQGLATQQGMAAVSRSGKQARADARTAQQATLDASSQMTFGTTVTFAPKPVAEITDPQALAISEDTGLSVETVQKLLTGFLALLFIIAQALCFGYAGKEFTREEEALDVPAAIPEPAEVPAAVEPFDGQKAAAPIPFVDDRDEERLQEVKQLGHALIADVATARSATSQVEEFIKTATASVPSQKTRAGELHQAYQDWARDRGYQPMLDFVNFGKKMTELIKSGRINVSRETGKHYFYVGIVPKYRVMDIEEREVA
jgi:ABC-type transport system involved in multi-copper enzyme maturation permease subunit